MLLWTLGCMYLFKWVFSFYLDLYPGVELLDHKVILFFSVLRRLHAVFHSVYTYLHSHQQYRVPFSLHPHQCLLSSPTFVFLIIAILTSISFLFWFAFLWWLTTLGIFSCACLPSVCPLWKISIQVLCQIFNGVVYFLYIELYELYTCWDIKSLSVI